MATVDPFPVGAPIRPEQRQIGRGPTIDRLHQQVVEHRQHTLLIGERRIGKTSVCRAILDRVRDHEEEIGWAIEVNLSRGPITSSSALALQLADEARAAGIRLGSRLDQVKNRLRSGVHIGGLPILAKVAELLGLPAEIEDIGELSEALDQSLSPQEEGDADLRGVLRALLAAAISRDKVLVIFIDEVQRVCTDWAGDADDDSEYTQEALAEVMEEHAGHAVLLLAGSDRAGLEQLMADGQPLRNDGMWFELPKIATEDWRHDLPARFAEVGLEIEPERIDQILEATGRHPQRTMSVCAHARELAGRGDPFGIGDVLIAQAIADARRHPSWT